MRDELTKVDIQKMKEEIEYRKGVLAPQLRSAVKSARELGDLSENDEYRSAKPRTQPQQQPHPLPAGHDRHGSRDFSRIKKRRGGIV